MGGQHLIARLGGGARGRVKLSSRASSLVDHVRAPAMVQRRLVRMQGRCQSQHVPDTRPLS
jgi:hypothetical protein